MFENIGGKIKGLAKLICWLGIITSCITGVIVMLSAGSMRNDAGMVAVITGLMIIVIGSLLSWIGSFFAYGFGQLIENSDRILEKKKYTEEPTKNENQEDESLTDEEKAERAKLRKQINREIREIL